MDIPICANCGKIAQYRCAIDGEYLCYRCARVAVVGAHHISKPEIPKKIEIEIVDKMRQDPGRRKIFEALWDILGYPPAESVDLTGEWIPPDFYPYKHREYNVKTLGIYADGEPVGFLDFLFTMDPEENLSIQYWKMSIHPKYQGGGLFRLMVEKLKQIAYENNVKRLVVSHENDNIPAFIAEYMLGGKILYTRDLAYEEPGRFGIPRRNDIVFVYELR
jgi:GNAT superfamily N-acetyltransferase